MSDKTDYDKIWVVDLETDNNGEGKPFSASPFYEDNDIVAGCWVELTYDGEDLVNTSRVVFHLSEGEERGTDEWSEKVDNETPWLLCGHNILFDVSYLRTVWKGLLPREISLDHSLRRGDTLLWDTQFAEYLLRGQAEGTWSLNHLAKEYGVGEKKEDVKSFWDAGIKTQDIDPDQLMEYVENDVVLTAEIAKQQIARAYEKGLLPFILQQMRSLWVVGEYEYNGMYINNKILDDIKHVHETAQASAEANYKDHICKLFDDEIKTEDVDINSTKQLRDIIFNGLITVNEWRDAGRYKTGKKKGEHKFVRRPVTKSTDKSLDVTQLSIDLMTPQGQRKVKIDGIPKAEYASLDANAVDQYLKMLPNGLAKFALQNYQSYKYHQKMVSTYCQNLFDYRFDWDGCIHPKYNVDITPTGRLTCSAPNLQNQPASEDADIKEAFTSRWDDGRIVAVDFKQLELVCLAYLSDDPTLARDLRDGVDIHGTIAREAGLNSGGDARREVKRVVFGSIYGAGSTKLAKSGRLSMKQVHRVQHVLTSRYKSAFEDFHFYISNQLESNQVMTGRSSRGLRIFESDLVQPSGRRIKFSTKDTGAYSYTKMKNWPVQSMAADIVSVARVLFYDEILDRRLDAHIKMVNEVHDEIVFDIEDKSYLPVMNDIKEDVRRALPNAISEMFGLESPFPLPLELKAGSGKNWKEAK